GINVRPLTWPISIGQTFKGVYNLVDGTLNLFEANKTSIERDIVSISDINDPKIDEIVGEKYATILREDVELIEGVYEPLNVDDYRNGKIAPVFFGSAVNNFGVQEMLDNFIKIAPAPIARDTDVRTVEPNDKNFTGFVFKIHANLDPKHRDRIAFLRICSGKFERNKFYKHVRLDKKFKFNNPTSFMAQDKSIIDEAWPGDVIGLYDTGNLKIGDTLSEGEKLFYKGVPSFSPEIFKELINKDPMKTKQLEKGINQLSEEGVAQLFTQQPGNRKIVGTVGNLQFEVIQHRLKHEYGASCEFHPMRFYNACWLTSENDKQLEDFCRVKSRYIAYDKDNNPVFLAETAFLLRTAQGDYQDITFHQTSDFKISAAV
ncbi:MAG: peptide chain release factor 3, partial [Flavobacteriales bacterium]|nr:peptide chain release factor 3 [Flavobacteriales bacterium]